MATINLPADCVDRLRDALIVVYPPGVVGQLNQAAVELLGATSKQAILNRPIGELLDAGAGNGIAGRVRLRRADGKMLDAQVSRYPDPTGLDPEVLCIAPVVDSKASVWLSEDTAALAARVGHELANMLTPVLGSVELCRHALGRSVVGPEREILDTVERFGNRLLLHAGNLRSLRPRTNLRRRPQDVARVVTRALETARQTGLAARHQIVNVAANARLPLVDIDADSVEQLIVNLIVNAAESMANPGLIEVELRRHGPVVELRVADHGPGIAAEVLARVDDPIGRLHQTHRGLGLGLYVVRRIAEQHDTQLVLGANVPRGAVATVEFRAAD